MNIFELHEKLTAGLFPAYSNSDERFLALALCGEAGELANMIKKRWRDGVDLSEQVRDEIADIRVYLELLAKCFDIEGDKLDARVKQKLEQVVEKHKVRLGVDPLRNNPVVGWMSEAQAEGILEEMRQERPR